jgi:flagellar secretion chaperone FliS
MHAMRPHSAAKAYSMIGVETGVAAANPHSLILMLYDGALQAIADALRHLDARAVADKGRAVSRAISIIDEGLKGCLDRSAGGEIASHLGELYDYMCRRLLLASLKDDRRGFDEVARLLNELRGAWATIAAAPTPAETPADLTAV